MEKEREEEEKVIKKITSEEIKKSNYDYYECLNCGTKGKYTVTMRRFIEPLFDGPNSPPWGHIDDGSYVIARCDNCQYAMDPSNIDMDRLFVWRKGLVLTNE